MVVWNVGMFYSMLWVSFMQGCVFKLIVAKLGMYHRSVDLMYLSFFGLSPCISSAVGTDLKFENRTGNEESWNCLDVCTAELYMAYILLELCCLVDIAASSYTEDTASECMSVYACSIT